ncbi:lantibiotic dehydratase [Actinocorallia sp. A-T 12471]|uniref:lantibiotic dehydratase n=1 Tax=Actinocorallia sp. A-T 12471 TaxID=3089813 RepID=UPI0029CEAABC|nr:lantibiotic dehydratase [Actinocorallia sp. A-T 12471]MDX6742932.1 lantibiotic dehydratase [Actinocorallia sp. A-T 12471]
MYDYFDVAVVRAAALPQSSLVRQWPDLTDRADPTAWRSWLERVSHLREFSVALAQASPSLAHRVQQIRDGHPLPTQAVRSAVVSVMRYLLRASERPTPFGLFSGVGTARISGRSACCLGDGHRAVVRPDAEWLTSVIERLEADPAIRPHLKVVASSLASKADDHLIIEHRPGGTTGTSPVHARIRATAPVEKVLELAHAPIGIGELVEKLAGEFPDGRVEAIDHLVAELIAHRFLITNLRPTMTTPWPLRTLDTRLQDIKAEADNVAIVDELHHVNQLMTAHNEATNANDAACHRETLAARMRDLHPPARSPLAVDLRLDHDVTVPDDVAREAAASASVLARLARHHSLNPGWDGWHRRFLERYGPYAVVPLLSAVDVYTGLGYPDGFLGSPPLPSASRIGDRDVLLLGLAQKAALHGEREIVLDDELLSRLSPTPPTRIQTTTEVTVRVESPSLTALDSGEFTLTITNVSRMAGTMTGRFLHLLDAEERERLTSWYAHRRPAVEGARIVQISAPTRYTASENVARTVQAVPSVIALGEYREDSDQIPLDDLAVTADRDRLYLLSLAHRQVLEPVLLNAVEPVNHAHPLARFLAEATTATSAPCTAFDWGAAAKLPFLPAVRFGRTLLAPARWQLTAEDLPGPDADERTWDRAFTVWREDVRLPLRIQLGDGDQRITLDLGEYAHRALVREHLNRSGRASLRTAPWAGAAGWIGGHAHEIVVPLVSRGAPAPAPTWIHAETAVPGRGFVSGHAGLFSLKLYGNPNRLDDVLIRHLPRLLDQLPDAQRWFLRYQDPRQHLRLRLSCPSESTADTAERIAKWTQRLLESGLTSDVHWDTYFPETARFGGPTAIDLAEALFAADSSAALGQLTASREPGGADRRALTAAGLLALAADFIGDTAEAMRWIVEHTRTTSNAPERQLYRQAVSLADPEDRAALAELPGGAEVLSSWEERTQAAASYREALGTPDLIDRVLKDLLHLHHARMIGPDLESEAACLHLARAAALSRLARNRRTQ